MTCDVMLDTNSLIELLLSRSGRCLLLFPAAVGLFLMVRVIKKHKYRVNLKCIGTTNFNNCFPHF